MIRALVAIDDKRGIAARNSLAWDIPWDIPEDRKYFRQLTENHTVLMGRQTYGTLERPFDRRRNVVASRVLDQVSEGFELTNDAVDFLQEAAEDVWVIGGGDLFADTLLLCDELYITQVEGDFDCDRFFPEFEDQFTLSEQTAWQTSGSYRYRHLVYKRQ